MESSGYLKSAGRLTGFCVPVEFHRYGGMYTFLEQFYAFLDRSGIPYTHDAEADYNVLLAPSFMVPYEVVRRAKAKKRDIWVVQRVDGSARDYGRFDDADARQARINMLADVTIFQSRYGKYATTQKFKVIQQDGPVIFNPVDVAKFTPFGPSHDLPYRIKVCHVTFSTNPRKGSALLYAAAQLNPDVDFVLCGRYNALPGLPNVHFLGSMEQDRLAEVYRACDVFATFSENEACPNVVLEALASGLPILYKQSGGVRELVEECGLPVEVGNFRESLERVLVRQKELSEKARARAVAQFSPDVIFPQYLSAIEQAVQKPLPTLIDFLRAQTLGYPVLSFSFQEWGKKLGRKLLRGSAALARGNRP